MTDNLKGLFDALQNRLSAGLIAARTTIGHPVAKGDASEINWLDLLQRHLPHRYQADKAFAIDSQGVLSEQIDIVIYDRQYTPVMYNHDEQIVVPAESVYAVLEVKQQLDKGNVEYAGGKTASVRNLNRTSAPIVNQGVEGEGRQLTPILSGILTYESTWNPSFGDAFQQALRDRAPIEQIDIGCVVQSGGFEVTYNDKGIGEIIVSSQEHALVFFFMRLLHRLQKIGTVPAIDYEAYTNWLKQ